MRYIETSVFLHWLSNGKEHGERATEIIEQVETGEKGVTSSLTLIELGAILGKNSRTYNSEDLVKSVLSLNNLTVHAVDEDLLEEAAVTADRYELSLSEAVHYVTASRTRCTRIYSRNESFERTPLRTVF